MGGSPPPPPPPPSALLCCVVFFVVQGQDFPAWCTWSCGPTPRGLPRPGQTTMSNFHRVGRDQYVPFIKISNFLIREALQPCSPTQPVATSQSARVTEQQSVGSSTDYQTGVECCLSKSFCVNGMGTSTVGFIRPSGGWLRDYAPAGHAGHNTSLARQPSSSLCQKSSVAQLNTLM